MTRASLIGMMVVGLCTGCGGEGDRGRVSVDLRIFHAAGLTPVLDAVREDARRGLGLKLVTESSGSQVACRKLSELGRSCDLVMVADAALIVQLLGGVCEWRLDFAHDEMVLGVGLRAPHVSEAEEKWPAVLLRDDVRIGRVDENQGPVGYRALLVWKLQEPLGPAGLYDGLLKKCDKVVDHVTRLTPLLKNGEIDYAFVYRSICIARDIRYVELDRRINLGSGEVDYSHAAVTYDKLKTGAREAITVRGAPVTWALSIPDQAANPEAAARFIRYLLTDKGDVLERNGFRRIEPAEFHGPVAALKPLSAFARHVGDLK